MTPICSPRVFDILQDLPRIKGDALVAEGQAPIASEQLRKIFKGKIIAAGGFEPDTAEAIVEKGDAVWSRSGVTSFRIRICRSASSWQGKTVLLDISRG